MKEREREIETERGRQRERREVENNGGFILYCNKTQFGVKDTGFHIITLATYGIFMTRFET